MESDNLKPVALCHSMKGAQEFILKTKHNMSRDIRFPTMWYVRPAKPQISLRIRAV